MKTEKLIKRLDELLAVGSQEQGVRGSGLYGVLPKCFFETEFLV